MSSDDQEEQPLSDDPSFDEVLHLIARGRDDGTFTTGSPIVFRISDGRTATIRIHPDCVDR